MKRTDLHTYQERAVKFVEDGTGVGLFIQMGCGKTIITLTAIADLMNWCEVNKVLVIAPKKVAESTWSDEVAAWDHTNWLTTSVILGDAKHREEALNTDADIYVTSRDNFVWLAQYYLGSSGQMLKTNPWPFDMVVIDELTSFKSSDSKRFKTFKRLRPYMQRVVGLTGTPTPNGLKDLWGQMYCIDMGAALGRYKSHFLETYFNVYRVNNVPVKISLKPGAEEAITKLIDPKVLTMKASDYLELPELIERTVRVRWDPETKKRYDRFEEECVLEFDEEATPTVIASNAAALAGKLLQFCNGAIYASDATDGPRMIEMLHDEKINALARLLEAAKEEGNSVLIFYEFQHDCPRIQLLANELGMRYRMYKSDADLKDWNAGKIDVLCTHPASTAYGLNMQKGGHIIIWFGTGWNAELYLQGNARLHRQGQTEPTIIYRMVMADSMDERALQAVSGKIDTQNAIVDALKELKKQYKK